MDRLVRLTVRNTVGLAEILLTPPPCKVKMKGVAQLGNVALNVLPE